MIDDRTTHLNLPLPHQDNYLSDDVLRLRAAITSIDSKTAFLDNVLQSDDLTLDTVQEIVTAVKENRADIEGYTQLAADANAAKLAAEAARDEAVAVAENYIYSATQPANPSAGEFPLWWDGSVMRVWDGANWTDASSSVSGLRQVFHFALAAGQTVVSGLDAGGAAMVFDRAAYVDVFLNGNRLVLDSDFTVSVVAQSITLAVPAAADGLDVLDVVSYTNLMMVDADFETVFAQKADLGTAAAADLTASTTDTTAGRALKVGDFGTGNTDDASLIDDFAKHWPGGVYRCLGSSGGSANAPYSAAVVGAVRVLRSGAALTVFMVVLGESVWSAVYDGSVLSAWIELLHAGNLAVTDAQHGSRSGGALHATATTSTSGFLSAADKSKLDGVQSGAQVNAVTSVSGRTGAVTLTKSDVGLDSVPNVDSQNASNLTSGIVPNARLNSATTTAPGIVQLNNTLTSTSTAQALTAAQGKALNDALAGKAESSHTHGYLPLSGGSLTGDIVFGDSNRDSSPMGTYNAEKTQQIWSMGTAYRSSATGVDFGGLYGLAYKHTTNATGGTMAGGHQMVWAQAGVPKCALGDGFWTAGYSFLGESSPGIKIKKLTTTTPVLNNGTRNVAHGLTGTKILQAFATIEFATGEWGVPNTDTAGYECRIRWDNTNVILSLVGTNSAAITDKPVTITIVYEA